MQTGNGVGVGVGVTGPAKPTSTLLHGVGQKARALCFYHSADFDGVCSAAIVSYHVPDLVFMPINYDQPFPWDMVGPEDTVYMVDFHLQPLDLMRRLVNSCEKVVWIDHHKSAIEVADSRLYTDLLRIPGIRRIGTGACALTWEWIFGNPKNLPSLRMPPPAVVLLAQYDVWNHENPLTLPFQYGLRGIRGISNPADPIWHGHLLDHSSRLWQSIAEEGKKILPYLEIDNEKRAAACAFDLKWEGHNFIAINHQLTSGQVFDSVWDEAKYHGMLTFGYRGGSWHVSMYSTRKDVDLSFIAVKYGGGGHAGACGFECLALPFNVPHKDDTQLWPYSSGVGAGIE